MSPANAAAYDSGTGNGEVSCTTGTISITNYVVSDGATCAGSVVVPNGVTAIGDSDQFYPFQGNSTLTNITIPQSVTDIGSFSFDGATALESIVIPDGVTEILEATFRNATALREVTIPEGVTTIGDDAFRNTGLESVTIPATVTTIGVWAFFLTSSLQNLYFEDGESQLTVGDYAFESTGLESVTLPARVISIGRSAFAGNYNLSSFEFESGSILTSIGVYAFSGSTALRSIALPSSLTSIGLNAFRSSSLKYIEIPATVTSIGAWSFEGLSDVHFYFHGVAPAADSVDPRAFENSSGLIFVPALNPEYLATFPADPDGKWNSLTPAGLFYDASFDSNGGTSVRSGVFGHSNTAPFFYEVGAAPQAPTKSGALFAGWSATDNVNGEKIDFPYTPGVANDIILYALWTLPFDATTGDGFVNCSISGNFIIIDNVVMESDSCRGTAAIPDSVTELSDRSFIESGLTSVTFGAGSKLNHIGNRAFDESSLASITIPAGVTAIGTSAFRGTGNLDTVLFADNSRLEFIGEKAFEDADFSSIQIPASVTHIWDDAFSESNLTTVTIPANVTHIGSSAFYESYDLASVTFAAGSKLSFIGASAFSDTGLESIEIPASVVTIGSFAFSNCGDLESITFAPGSKAVYFGEYAFSNTAITSIQIPSGITNFTESLFGDADDLESFYFLGNAPSVTRNQFADLGANPKAFIKSTATGFPAVNSLWYGLTVEIGVYDVAFNSNGGSAVASDAFVAGGAIATPETPEKSGFTLAGWSATDGGDVVTFPYSPAATSNITLFAKWTSDAAPVVDTPVVNTPAVNTPAAIATGSNASLGVAISFSAKASVLTKAHKAALKRSVKASGKNATYVVTGTAGMLPGTTKAQVRKLANLRANVIKAYLVKLGVNKANISIKIKITNQGIVPKTKTLAKYLVS